MLVVGRIRLFSGLSVMYYSMRQTIDIKFFYGQTTLSPSNRQELSIMRVKSSWQDFRLVGG